jgi:hypothetical protein
MTHTILHALRRNGSADFQAEKEITGDGEIELAIALAASGTPKTVTFDFAIAALAELVLLSDVAASIVLKDSGGSAIGSPIVLEANIPFVWHSALNPAVALADLFDTDPATLAVTNTSSPLATGTLNVYGLYDATP